MADTGKTIALIKALGGSGNALPPITASDNGKVLTANSGVWGASDPIGKRFIVTLTINNTEPIEGTMDKTIGEIEAAYNAGRCVEFVLQTEMVLFVMPLQYVSVIDETWIAHFSAVTDSAMLYSGYTSGTSDKTSTDFGVDIYALTPAT